MPPVRTRRNAALPRPLLLIVADPSYGGGNYSPDEEIATAFLRDTVRLASHPSIGAEVRAAIDSGSAAPPPDIALPPGSWLMRRGNTPDERLAALFEDSFGTREAVQRPVCMVVGNIPHLPVAFVREALGRLQRPDVDIVLGPNEGGSYYFIGLKEPNPGLFAQIVWNRPASVPTETMEQAAESAGRVAHLPAWYTLDAPEDLDRLRRDVERGVAVAPETHAVLRRRRTTD